MTNSSSEVSVSGTANPLVEPALFSTPWFAVHQRPGLDGAPHYIIDAPDFVVIVAANPHGRLMLVRQFRPAVNAVTLELPAGHVELGDSPEKTARKELFEETGCEAGEIELLARFSPSTARFSNTMYCFYASGVCPGVSSEFSREAGVDVVFYEGGWRDLLQEADFKSAHSCAALFAAVAAGKLK